MPKINQEEYEVLKALDDKWKWISRDGECNSLNVFSVKPIKAHSQWDYMDVGYNHAGLTKEENNMFQFIQWEDEEPYNVAELIEEYEKDYKGSWEHAVEFSEEVFGESEETEVKKDIEWLREQIENEMNSWGGGNPDYFRGAEDAYEDAKDWLNQLDEPEVLTPKWIEDNEFLVNDESGVDYTVVESRKLKGLLVPKQEEQSAKTVADVIADFYKSLERLKEVLSTEVEGLEE